MGLAPASRRSLRRSNGPAAGDLGLAVGEGHPGAFCCLACPVRQAPRCGADALDLTDQRLAGLLCLSGEALQRLDLPPLHDHRLEDLLVMLQQVVEAGVGDGLGVPFEARNAGARHLEVADLALDGRHDQ